MNRKLIAIGLSAAMVMSFAVTALAEEATESAAEGTLTLTYDMIDPDVYEGQWVETGIGYDVYLPSDWVLNEVTDEQAEAGLVMLAGQEGGGANMTVVSTEVPAEAAETYTIDSLYAELSQAYSSVTYGEINGIQGILFDDDTNKLSGFTVLETYDDGSWITNFVIAPPSDDEYEEFSPYFMNMFSSISYTENAEEAETE